MPSTYLEHANVTVKNIDETAHFIATAMPDWRVRGEGRMDWFGKQIRWLHIGTDDSYLALQDGGEGAGLNWREHQVGVKHLGVIVSSIDAVIESLQKVGYELDHHGASHPYRRSVYFVVSDNLQFEFIEYQSELKEERNDYSC